MIPFSPVGITSIPGESRSVERDARAADQAAGALAFDRAATLYLEALELRSDDGRGPRLWARLGDALANAGRAPEAARAYREAANGSSDGEEIELLRLAAMQYLISGHVDEGTAVLRVVLDRVGLKLPKTPRRALWSLLLGRMLIRLRGTSFRERDASRVDAKDLQTIDIVNSAAYGLGNVDPIGSAAFQTKNLLMALRTGEPHRRARAALLGIGTLRTVDKSVGYIMGKIK